MGSRGPTSVIPVSWCVRQGGPNPADDQYNPANMTQFLRQFFYFMSFRVKSAGRPRYNGANV